MKMYNRRDLTIIEISREKCLIMACDSCGGIGEKPSDSLNASPTLVGSHSARVVLMEVLCTGAEIISVSNAVCCEMNPTAALVIEGVKKELQRAGITNAVLNGSTEENIPTSMTALGISVVGIADISRLKFGLCHVGDKIILIGRPLVGAELLSNVKLPDYSNVYRLLENPYVREIVPVGSKGVGYEANLLATLNGLHFTPENSGINLTKSAGPCTAIIAAVDSEQLSNLSNFTIIGSLH